MSAAQSGHNGAAPLPSWVDLEPVVPAIVATMRRYLQQIGCILRPGSVVNTEITLRSFAAFLVECAPDVASVADVVRRHVEDYKPWLAARPGQNKPTVTPATIAHRLGTLRMFFLRARRLISVLAMLAGALTGGVLLAYGSARDASTGPSPRPPRLPASATSTHTVCVTR